MISICSFGNRRAEWSFFSIGFILWLFCRILLTSNFGYDGGAVFKILNIGLYGGLFLCIFSELFAESITLKSFSLVCVLILMTLLLLRVGGNDACFMLLLAFLGRRFRFRNILLLGVSTTVVAVLVVVGSFSIGIIGQTYEGARSRGSLGFGWVTFLSHYFLMISIGYTVLRGEGIKRVELLALLIIDCVIYSFTGARNSFVLGLLFLSVVFIAKLANHWRAGKIACFISASVFPICAVISWILYMKINPYTVFGMSLNSLFSGRIALSQQALSLYGINLFGNAVQWVTQSSIRSGLYSLSQYLYVDCSYLNFLINFGLLVFIVLIMALSIVSFQVVNHGGFILGIAFAIFAVHGIVDPQLLDLHYCTFLFLLGGVLDSNASWDARLFGLVPKSQKT